MVEVKLEPEVVFEYCVLCSQNFSSQRETLLDEENVFKSVKACFSIRYSHDIDGAVCPSCRQRLAKAQRLKRYILDTLNKLNNVNSSHSEVGPAEEKSPCGVPPDAGAIESEHFRQIHIQYFPHGDNDFEQNQKNDSTLNNLEIRHGENKTSNRNVPSEDFPSNLHQNFQTITTTDARNYECTVCFKAFKTFSTLKRHTVIHNDQRKFKCDICSKTFKTKHNLNCHMICHSDERNYKCDVCDKAFKTNLCLTKHTVCHSTERNFKCSLCSKAFKSKRLLKSHTSVHGEKNHECSVCYKTYKSKISLKTHMVSHSDKRDFQCSVCYKTFKTKVNLKHIFSHINERNFKGGVKNNLHLKSNINYRISGTDLEKCCVCFKTFKTKYNLKRHMFSHIDKLNFECSRCSKDFRTKTLLNRDMRFHIVKQKFKCADCAKTFKCNDDLIRHMLIHSRVRDWKCSICFKTAFKTDGDIKLHMISHKIEFDLQCSICSKIFKTRNSLREHKFLCSETLIDIRDFRCDVCPRRFKLESDLDEHKNSHSSLNVRVNLVRLEYLESVAGKVSDDGLTYTLTSADVLSLRFNETECSDLPCGYFRWENKDDSTLHIAKRKNVYNRKKRFGCNICSKEFLLASTLNIHRMYHMNHNEERYFKCDVCFKAFKSKCSLNNHRSRHSDKTKDRNAVSVLKSSNITLYYGSRQIVQWHRKKN